MKRKQQQEEKPSKKTKVLDQYWSGILENVTHPTAISLMKTLDHTAATGFPTDKKAGKIMTTTNEAAERFPRHVILIQVGDFFESHGVSALCLMEFGGLRAMGAIPTMRAGTPKRSVQRLLNSLVHKNLKVAIFNEFNNTSKGFIDRKLAQVVSPAAPLFLFRHHNGDASDDDENDVISQPVVLVKYGVTVFNVQEKTKKHFDIEKHCQEAFIESLNPYDCYTDEDVEDYDRY